MPARKAPPGRGRTAQPSQVSRSAFTLTTLEQVRAISDPLRVRLLQAFAEESTTKQVAERLGEKPTRLYHHVEALESAGLLRLTRTQQKRGTLEKYFLVVARTFRTSKSLFKPGSEFEDSFQEVVGTLLDNTSDELRELSAREGGLARLESEGLLSYCEVRASKRELAGLRARLERELRAAAAEASKEPAPPGRRGSARRRFRLLIAFFPLDPPESEE